MTNDAASAASDFHSFMLLPPLFPDILAKGGRTLRRAARKSPERGATKGPGLPGPLSCGAWPLPGRGRRHRLLQGGGSGVGHRVADEDVRRARRLAVIGGVRAFVRMQQGAVEAQPAEYALG